MYNFCSTKQKDEHLFIIKKKEVFLVKEDLQMKAYLQIEYHLKFIFLIINFLTHL